MIDDSEVSIEQEVVNTKMGRPHVFVLGAGASRATCLQGDKNGATLPLMNDLVNCLDIRKILEEWNIDPNKNFEDIYSSLYEKGETEKIKIVQTAVENYFSKIEIPDKPTIYDHLILSLRSKDIIVTFNWDPLLMQAYLRNQKSGLSQPKLAFLHGNIMVGMCEKDNVSSLAGRPCSRCGKIVEMVPLLYPVGKKDYATNPFIANEWKILRRGFKDAFMITIFGYSAPKTDEEAIAMMSDTWGPSYKREMEQTSFIDIASEENICANWDRFIHSHHYEVQDDFYKSWLANHPRRTGEAYINQYVEAKYVTDNPIPKDLDFPELWDWYKKFKPPEGNS